MKTNMIWRSPLRIPPFAPGAARRPAFTLIEVLIAVLVLALGLLGLGAVFPVVVRQQRQASDVVLGINALRSAETYILSHGKGISRPSTGTAVMGWLNEKSVKPSPWTLAAGQQEPNARGWDYLLADATMTLGKGGAEESMKGWSLPNYKWAPQPLVSVDPKKVQLSQDKFPDAFGLRIGYQMTAWPVGKAVGNEPLIPLAQRLFPLPDSSGGDPQYVWDFVGRRVVGGSWGSQEVQLAIFVRRIDTGIAVPPGHTLTDVLLNRRLALGQMRVPVGATFADTTPTTGSWNKQSPTMNGTGYYSPIMIADVSFSGPTRLTVQVGTDPKVDPVRRALRQIGQKLVDNRGKVYTVIRLEEDTRLSDWKDSVFVDATFSQAEITQSTTKVSSEWPIAIAFTPQIPAAVSVLTIPR